MGGIKNREEKKKKNHVFSSGGGGGGTKGPDKIDKRNQELPCPHCDRKFKQVQRLRDHVAKQHADKTDAPEQEVIAPPLGAQTEKVMDVGSGPGAWTRKSPRLLLLEWTQTSKRPKPRYKALVDEGGTFRCKVVLPDAKDNNNDLVVFLNGAHACDSEEAALQSGALAALHSVAGDRALHRILPSAYLPLWDTLAEEAKQRQEQTARREARAENQREQEKARRAAEARRKPSQVVMSKEKRQLVEAALSGMSLQADDSASSQAGGMVSAEQALAQLQALGFSADHSAMALAAVNNEGGVNIPNTLDWLCLNLPAASLPTGFAPDASDRPVELLNGRNTANGVRLANSSQAGELTGWGYSAEDVASALAAHDGNGDGAHEMLFTRLTGASTSGGFNGPTSPEWLEEMEALQAIHGDNLTQLTPNRVQISLDDGRTVLDLRIPSTYPEAAPLIAARCEELSSRALLELTLRIAQVSHTLVGAPMVHDLAIACEELQADKCALESNAQEPRSLLHEPHTRPLSEDGLGNGPSSEKEGTEGDRLGSSQGKGAFQKKDGSRRVLSRQETQAESRRLLELAKKVGGRDSKIQASRRKLPAFSMREELLTMLQRNSVLVISGSTGCGKSTQVPQFILEDAVDGGKGAECNIICTQPRRISAIGLAQRVSQERSEDVGSVVGHSVRFDTKTSQRTRLLFCTTGILLRRLISDPELSGVTHVMVDEVHERSVDSDLLLLLLKALQDRRGATAPKIVLMSATADSQLFSTYFSNSSTGTVGQLSIPGFTHPVTDFHLEEALEVTQLSIGPKSKWARSRQVQEAEDKAAKPVLQNSLGRPADSWEQVCLPTAYSEQTLKSLSWVDESLINNDLIETLICKILTPGGLQSLNKGDTIVPEIGSREGARAILVFLPGAPEIDRLIRQLDCSRTLKQACEGRKLKILPLHGSLGPAQQARVFDYAGPGEQKIVVATNVAETSITIPDVVCVIDSGRVKELSYDSAKGLSRLEEGWVSLAAAAQRRGRAGRVQPGICFKLFSRRQAASLQEHQVPEIRRTALHQLCLTVKAILPQNAPLQDTLTALLSPPEDKAIASAVTELTQMGALDHERLTALGQHLAGMPMHPRLGKALIYAAMLRCLDPVLTIVAALAYGRPVFQAPPDRREEAAAAKRALSEASPAAKSDHLTVIAAFNKWNKERLALGCKAAKQVCSSFFLSEAAMEGILSGRRDYAAALVDLGFVDHTYLHALGDTVQRSGHSNLDEFSGNARIVKAAICAGFYPSLLRVEHPAEKYAETHAGAFAVDAPPQKLRFMDRIKGRVFIHPGSVLFNVGRFECPWLIYTDMAETSKVYCREASMVPIYSLLLFGGSITVQHEKGLIKLDDWASFKSSPQTAVLVKMLRAEIDRLLLRKVEEPTYELSGSKTITALHQLLATDGF